MSKKLSPQGYIYGKDPTATNPFWEETSDSPSADAADYVKSVAISSVTNTDGSATYTVRTTAVSGDVDTTRDDTIDVPASVVEYLKSLTMTQAERDNYVDYTITTTNQDGTTTDHVISVPAAVATEYVKTLTKEKNTETGLTYLIVTDVNSDTVNITIGTLDSVTTANESTTTDGVNLVSVVETDADGNTDAHNLAYILAEPMAITSLTQSTDDAGVTSTALNLSGTDQAGNAVTSSIAVQTKTETDGSTGVYLALTNLNETSQKILSIAAISFNRSKFTIDINGEHLAPGMAQSMENDGYTTSPPVVYFPVTTLPTLEYVEDSGSFSVLLSNDSTVTATPYNNCYFTGGTCNVYWLGGINDADTHNMLAIAVFHNATASIGGNTIVFDDFGCTIHPSNIASTGSFTLIKLVTSGDHYYLIKLYGNLYVDGVGYTEGSFVFNYID